MAGVSHIDNTFAWTTASGFGTSLTLDVPVPTHSEGQLIVFAYTGWGPSGWSYELNQGGWTNPVLTYYYRIATGSEPSNYSVTISGSFSSTRRTLYAWMWVFDDFDPANITGDSASDSGTGTSMSLGDVFVDTGDAVVGRWTWLNTSTNSSLPAGWTTTGNQTDSSMSSAHGGYRVNLESPSHTLSASRNSSQGSWGGRALVIKAVPEAAIDSVMFDEIGGGVTAIDILELQYPTADTSFEVEGSITTDLQVTLAHAVTEQIGGTIAPELVATIADTVSDEVGASISARIAPIPHFPVSGAITVKGYQGVIMTDSGYTGAVTIKRYKGRIEQ